MYKGFINNLICPRCKSKRIYLYEQTNNNDYVVSGSIICKNCAKSYEIQNGIPNMIEYPKITSLNRQKWEILQKKFEKRALINGNIDQKKEKVLLKEWLTLIDFVNFEGKILDIGCGHILHYLSRRHFKCLDYEKFDYFGVDPLANFREYGALKFSKGLGEAIPYKNELFSSVIISSTLDHCLDPTFVLKESFRCLKKQGKLYIINRIHDRKRIIPENFNMSNFILDLLEFNIKEIKKFIAYHLNRLSHSKQFIILDIISILSEYFQISKLKVVNNRLYIEAVKNRLQ